MSTIHDRIKRKKLQLNQKIGLALLGGAVVLQSPELIESWAQSHHADQASSYENGNTPLHIAVQNSWVSATEILINNGISPAHSNHDDISAITLARNIYREYEHKVNQDFPSDESAAIKFVHARKVLDILDQYQYADHI